MDLVKYNDNDRKFTEIIINLNKNKIVFFLQSKHNFRLFHQNIICTTFPINLDTANSIGTLETYLIPGSTGSTFILNNITMYTLR